MLTTANVNAKAGNNAFASTRVPITDPGGTRKLYLVFQTVAGGPSSGFGQPQLDRVRRPGRRGYAVAPASGGGANRGRAPPPHRPRKPRTIP